MINLKQDTSLSIGTLFQILLNQARVRVCSYFLTTYPNNTKRVFSFIQAISIQKKNQVKISASEGWTSHLKCDWLNYIIETKNWILKKRRGYIAWLYYAIHWLISSTWSEKWSWTMFVDWERVLRLNVDCGLNRNHLFFL